MFNRINRIKLVCGLAAALSCLSSAAVLADGGIAIQGTRIVYPLNAHQVAVTVENSSTQDLYLLQSWVSDASGHKSHDFAVTPPLFVSHPGDENNLRLMLNATTLPKDRESLYYFIEKAIPSVNKNKIKGESVLLMATANRIKLFVRPAGLKPEVSEAPKALRFHRSGNNLEITNPTPYYITLTDVRVNGKALHDDMIAPQGKLMQPMPSGGGNSVSFHTINDFGAVTKEIIATIN